MLNYSKFPSPDYYFLSGMIKTDIFIWNFVEKIKNFMILSYFEYIYSENNSKISRFLVEFCRRNFDLIRVKLGEKNRAHFSK